MERVYVPWAVDPAATRLALCADDVAAEFVDVRKDEHAYGRLLTRLWREGDGFIVVEHDIVPPVGAVVAMRECPEPVCTHEYRLGRTKYGYGLGCIKIGAEAIRRAGPRDFRDVPWTGMDGAVFVALHGMTEHVHWPPAVHLNPYHAPLRETYDAATYIEEHRPGYVRYRRADGRRWEVDGVCDKRGDCLIGAVEPTTGEVIRDHAHIEELKRRLGVERLISLLDVPVTPEFRDCCPLVGQWLEGEVG